jgi:Uma2 family endonuclease
MSVTSGEPSIYELERNKPRPSKNHGIVQANLGAEFLKAKRFRPISELTLDLGEKPDLVPDLCIFRRESVDFAHDEVRVAEPPLIVVEITSPKQGTYEIFRKVDRYLKHGVASCWVVEPSLRTVKLIGADGQESVHHEGIITDPATGIEVDLDAVFS